MDDPFDTRDELETESPIDLEASQSDDEAKATEPTVDLVDHPFSLFSNREEEPEADASDDSPIDTLMKSGQPRLALVRGDEEPDDDGGLIELAPAEPAARSDADADDWPWIADTEVDDEAPLLKSLDAQFNSDLIAPTACGARPTSGEVSRRPMPSLPPKGEIASVAQRVGAQFAGDVRTVRTPDVPALLTTMPKTFAPAAPVKVSIDRPTISSNAPTIAPSAPMAITTAPVTTSSAPAAAMASIAITPETIVPATIAPATPAATIVSSAPPSTMPRKLPDTPKRIGDGKLVQSRLTWKPGDPFAEGARPAGMPGRFRWELMLSTACGTAVFGLAFFWIMRMVF